MCRDAPHGGVNLMQYLLTVHAVRLGLLPAEHAAVQLPPRCTRLADAECGVIALSCL